MFGLMPRANRVRSSRGDEHRSAPFIFALEIVMSSIGSLGKFVGFGFALSLAFPSAAAANALLSAPPDKYVVSPGGVDMRSGRYAYTHTDLSIGGDGEMELTRTLNQQALGHLNPFANFSHNFDMMVVETRVNINQGNFRNG